MQNSVMQKLMINKIKKYFHAQNSPKKQMVVSLIFVTWNNETIKIRKELVAISITIKIEKKSKFVPEHE